MVSFNVQMRFAASDRDEIAAILRELADASRQEPGCVTYIPLFVEADICTVLIVEQYKDEAAVEHHRQTPHFERLALRGLYRRMLDRKVETLLAIA